VTNEAQRRDVEAQFIEGNLSGDPHVELSPSGGYRLTVRNDRTGAHTWSYSRGTVTRVADDTVVCDSIAGIEAAIAMLAGEFTAPLTRKSACVGSTQAALALPE
jgi:hypothetical protein